jgi:hypothetical protein
MEDDEHLTSRDNVLYLLTELEWAFERGFKMSVGDIERTQRRLIRLAEAVTQVARNTKRSPRPLRRRRPPVAHRSR